MKNYLIKESEQQIQKKILEYLAYFGVYAWRVNSGKYAVGEGASRRFVIGAPTGTPDIIGVLGKTYKKHYGQMIGIEETRPGGKTSDAQEQMIAKLIDFGAYVFVAYSLDDVEEQLRRLQI